MTLRGAVAIAVLAIVFLALWWGKERVQRDSFEWGWKFGQVHTDLAAAAFGLVWAALGGFVIWRAVGGVASDRGSSAVPGAAASVLSLAVVGIWAYAHSRDYDLPPWVGRFLWAYAVLQGLALVVAFGGYPFPQPVEVFCLSMIATYVIALTPLIAVGWWRGRKDPARREAAGLRALRFVSSRPSRAPKRRER